MHRAVEYFYNTESGYVRGTAAMRGRRTPYRHTHLRLRSHKNVVMDWTCMDAQHLTFPKFLTSRRRRRHLLHRRCCCRSHRRRRRWCQWNHYRRMSSTWDEKQKQKSEGAHRQEASEQKRNHSICHSNSEQRENVVPLGWHYILDKFWNGFCCVDARGSWLGGIGRISAQILIVKGTHQCFAAANQFN